MQYNSKSTFAFLTVYAEDSQCLLPSSVLCIVKRQKAIRKHLLLYFQSDKSGLTKKQNPAGIYFIKVINNVSDLFKVNYKLQKKTQNDVPDLVLVFLFLTLKRSTHCSFISIVRLRTSKCQLRKDNHKYYSLLPPELIFPSQSYLI